MNSAVESWKSVTYVRRLRAYRSGSCCKRQRLVRRPCVQSHTLDFISPNITQLCDSVPPSSSSTRFTSTLVTCLERERARQLKGLYPLVSVSSRSRQSSQGAFVFNILGLVDFSSSPDERVAIPGTCGIACTALSKPSSRSLPLTWPSGCEVR